MVVSAFMDSMAFTQRLNFQREISRADISMYGYVVFFEIRITHHVCNAECFADEIGVLHHGCVQMRMLVEFFQPKALTDEFECPRFKQRGIRFI